MRSEGGVVRKECVQWFNRSTFNVNLIARNVRDERVDEATK